MYSKSQLAFKWFQYFAQASSGKGHGIHSPFVYQLIREVLNDDRDYYAYKLIETAKQNLLLDDRLLQVRDLGAGSGNSGDSEIMVSQIATKSVSSQKFGRLLFRLANFYRANIIVEMGSSLGISTAYLASADPGSQVITLEGSPAIAKIAGETFGKLKLENISQITGNFDELLSGVLLSHSRVDLVFIDGNHRKKPVLEYFEQFLQKISSSSLIVIHDIHWSREMEDAWLCIQEHPRVNMTVDIFSAGLVFFREEFQIKQKFTIRF
jgi:predicted O-methyltransferase YrrM